MPIPPAQANEPTDWEKCKSAYMEWATKEFVEGRKFRAITPSSARAVLGSVGRVVGKLADEGLQPYLAVG